VSPTPFPAPDPAPSGPRTRTYDLRGKKLCVVMAGSPYTESGAQFQIPDMLANRADVYNLGEVLNGRDDAFALSYIENALTSNRILAPGRERRQSGLGSEDRGASRLQLRARRPLGQRVHVAAGAVLRDLPPAPAQRPALSLVPTASTSTRGRGNLWPLHGLAREGAQVLRAGAVVSLPCPHPSCRPWRGMQASRREVDEVLSIGRT
jgi:hypothetical protein